MDPLAEEIRKRGEGGYADLRSVALAYSGGLDSDVVGAVLGEWGVAVHAVVFDMGGRGDAQAILKKARGRFPAASLVDIRAEITEAAYRGIKANGLEGGHLNVGAFSRPFMARGLVEVARRHAIPAVAHGSSGVGNDHLRFELALRVLAPELRALAPVRDWDLGRDQALAYAKRRGWKMAEGAHRFSSDENLWGRSVRQGELVDAAAPLPPGACTWTAEPEDAPDARAEVAVRFRRGIPIACTVVEGGRRSAATGGKLIEKLNEVGGRHGVGRFDHVVDKIVGLKMREAHECPAAAILVAAHQDLERLCLTDSELEAKAVIERMWNKCVYDGGWYSRLRRDLDAFIDETQTAVSGMVHLHLHKGGVRVVGRSSPRALYDDRLGRRDARGAFGQSGARQFARLYGLQETMAYLMPPPADGRD